MINYSPHVVIAGGGLTGCLLALAISKNTYASKTKPKITILEKQSPPLYSDSVISQSLTNNLRQLQAHEYFQQPNRPLGRSIALNKFATNYLSQLLALDTSTVGYINDVFVTTYNRKEYLHYNNNHDVEDKQSTANKMLTTSLSDKLGCVLFNWQLHASLLTAIASDDNIEIIYNTNLESIKETSSSVQITTDKGMLSAQLLCLAQGRHSASKHLFNKPIIQHSYANKSCTAIVEHSISHDQWAMEHFFPQGQVALLPSMWPNHSFLIFTYPQQVIHEITGSLTYRTRSTASQTEIQKGFVSFLNRLLAERDFFGLIIAAQDIQVWDIELQFAPSTFQNRMIVLGDMANAIHPVAGQGFNLSVNNIDALAQQISHACNYGLDLQFVCQPYSRSVFASRAAMSLFTHTLDWTMTRSAPLWRACVGKGIQIIEESQMLHQFTQNYAANGYKNVFK